MEVPMVGREEEMATLGALLDGASSGRGGFACIEGVAGIGKTTIVQAAVDAALVRNFVSFRGAATELERGTPFGPLVDAFQIGRAREGERALIRRLLLGEPVEEAGLQVDLGPNLQLRTLSTFVDLVERIASQQPMVLILEDLHWTDASTAMTLHALRHRVTHLPVAALLTYRPLPRVPELERLVVELTAGGQPHVLISPLGDAHIAAVVEALVRRAPGPRLLAQAHKAGGNPLFVIEVVRALRDEGALEPTGAGIEAIAGVAPTTLGNTILRRLNLVSDATAELLKIASILGTAFSLSELSLVSGRPAVTLLSPLDEAMRAGVIAEAGTQLSFRHDVLRETLYEAIPIAIRTALHLEAGRALADADAPPRRVAQHLALGASVGDDAAVRWLARAGREAMPRAPAVGAELLERALEIAGPTHPARDDLLADLVVADVWCGRASEGAARAMDILQRATGSDVARRVRVALVQALLMQGNWREALDVADGHCALTDVDQAERARLLAETVLPEIYRHGPDAAYRRGAEAIAIAEASHDALVLTVAYSGQAVAVYFESRMHEAVEAAERAVAAAAGSDEARRRHPQFILGQGLTGADRLEEAERVHQAGLIAGEELGTGWHPSWYHAALASRRFFAGDWDDAVTMGEAALALADDVGTDLGRSYVECILGLIALHRDDMAAAQQWIGGAAEIAAVTPGQLGSDWVPWAEALLHEMRGDSEHALRRLRSAFDQFGSIGLLTSQARVAADLVRLAVAANDAETVERAAAATDEAALRSPTPTLQGLALLCRAAKQDDAELYLSAVEAYRRGPRRFDHAYAAEQAASALARSGRIENAAPYFEEAMDHYGQIGASRDEARLSKVMRGHGLRRGARGARRRPSSGWDSLTPSEVEAVRLVVEGLSNPAIAQRLFVSRHTVETHLRHVFAKLGVASRTELAVEAVPRLNRPPGPDQRRSSR